MPMLALSLAQKGMPLLHLQDTVSFALDCMDDYEVQHLVIVKEDYFLGIISKSVLSTMDLMLPLERLSNHFMKTGIAANAHFLTALEICTKHQLSLLPVLNEQQECVGIITITQLNNALAHFLDVKMPGALLVLSVAPYQYSLTELSRIVEANNAQIRQLNSYFDEVTGNLVVTIKLNKEELGAVIATFERYDYQIIHYFGITPLKDDLENHYKNLMNYLDV